MKHDQAHAVQHAALYSVHYEIGYLVVSFMTPPNQHVRCIKRGI
jgi:hypothetical protein